MSEQVIKEKIVKDQNVNDQNIKDHNIKNHNTENAGINIIHISNKEKELRMQIDEFTEQKKQMIDLLSEYIMPIAQDIAKETVSQELKRFDRPLLDAAWSYTDKRIKRIDDKAEAMKIVAYEAVCPACKKVHLFEHGIKLKCPKCKTPFEELFVRQGCDKCMTNNKYDK